MGFFQRLFGFSKNSETFTDEELIEAGACPNCWGRQDYEGKYIQFVEDKTKSNISNDKAGKKAFIQQFVETNVTGIKLKRDADKIVCSACNKRF